ncbi:hypothetical protein SALBM311S_12791 [Streptomyces alboniger]
MSDTPAESAEYATGPDFDEMTRDIAEVPAVEVIVTVAVNLMSAAAVKLGLTEEGDKYKDLDEARKLIHALAGLLDGSATEISSFHAAPLRDGLKFRSSSRSARHPWSRTSRAMARARSTPAPSTASPPRRTTAGPF